MTNLAPNVWFVLLSTIGGMAALAPLRSRIGPGLFHGAALPVGLLGWAYVTALSTATGTAFSRSYVHTRYAVLVLSVAVLLAAWSTYATRHQAAPATRERRWDRPAVVALLIVVHLTLLLVAAGWFTERGTYYATDDSWAGYETSGVRIHDTGAFYPRQLSSRAPLIPSMHAAHRALGGDFLFTVYPFVALSVLTLLATAVWDRSGRSLSGVGRMSLVVVTVALLGSSAPFLIHATYVHSHMLTAAFLLLSALMTLESRHRGALVLPVAALGAAGVALARPDGWAYVLVAALPMALECVEGRSSRKRLASFFVPLLIAMWGLYLPIFLTLGLWKTPKQSGTVALTALVALTLLPLLLIGVRRVRPLRVLLERPRGTSVLVASVLGVGVLVALAVDPERALAAWQNMALNLLRYGGWSLMWYALAGFLAVAIAFPVVRREAPDGHTLLLTIATFLGGAMIVHGLAHPGRLSFADSFNRIAFHVVPLMFWYAGSLTSAAWGRGKDVEVASDLERA